MTDMYSPCPCGSGKKFKFCCFKSGQQLRQLNPQEFLERLASFGPPQCLVNRDWQERGLATVMVVRPTPDQRYAVGLFLVDVYCLGLKNVLFRSNFSSSQFNDFKARQWDANDPISYEDARSLILGGIDYARGLGFEPHPDWSRGRYLVEDALPYVPRFEFGRDGKPFYIQGPEDDTRAIMAVLGERAQHGEADFVVKLDDIGNLSDRRSFRMQCNRVSDDVEAGRLERALVGAGTLLETHPDSPETLFLMGSVLAASGDCKAAIPYLERSVESRPIPESLYNLGCACIKTGDIPRSVECLERVIRLDGERGDVGALARRQLKELDQMSRTTSGIILQQMVLNMRQYQESYQDLMAFKPEKAISGFQRILDSEPTHVRVHGNLGLAYAMLGEKGRALQHLDRALELDPSYEPALANRTAIRVLPPGVKLDPRNCRAIDYEFEHQAGEEQHRPLRDRSK